MRVALSSTWGVRCGIAVYTKRLRDSIRHLGHESISVNLTGDRNAFIKEVSNFQPDILHIQYEPVMLPLEELVYRTTSIKNACGTRIVLTLHFPTQEMFERLSFYVDKLISHRSYWLNKKDGWDNALYIPMPCPDYISSFYPGFRMKYGIPHDATVLTTLGFLSPWKSTDVCIENLCKTIRENNRLDVFLQVMTSLHFMSQYESHLIFNRILESTERYGIKSFLTSDFLKDDVLLERVALSDLGFLYAPVNTAGNSAAGLEFLAGRVPVVVTESDHFASLDDSWCIRTPFDLPVFTKSILDISKDRDRLSKMRGAAELEYQNRSYNKFALKHVEIYESLLKTGVAI